MQKNKTLFDKYFNQILITLFTTFLLWISNVVNTTKEKVIAIESHLKIVDKNEKELKDREDFITKSMLNDISYDLRISYLEEKHK